MTPEQEVQALAHEGRFSKFFVERRVIAWALLLLTLILGIFGFISMPKRKDPQILVRLATAITVWPGMDAQRVEQLVTRPIEESIAENSRLHPPNAQYYGIHSLTLPGVSIVTIKLDEEVEEPEREYADIHLRLRELNEALPPGVQDIQFNSGFGDTAALMLTLASPPEREVTVSLRAQEMAKALQELRAHTPPAKAGSQRLAILYALPQGAEHTEVSKVLVDDFAHRLETESDSRAAHTFLHDSFVGLDIETTLSPDELFTQATEFLETKVHVGRFHPEAWSPIVLHSKEGEKIYQELMKVRGPQFSYRQLRDFSRLIQRGLISVPEVSKVRFQGDLTEQIELLFKQENVSNIDVALDRMSSAIRQRNISQAAGRFSGNELDVFVQPSGELETLDDIRHTVVSTQASGQPLYLGSMADIRRTYQFPPQQLNWLTTQTPLDGVQRMPAITLSVFMRDHQQIADFGVHVAQALEELQDSLPEELIIHRTSDQPRQVEENVELFMDALYEAILLVVFIAWIGFRDWRSALLMMLSIPLTLSMTLGACSALGIEIHQVSIAGLIIALGLLVDDPVVAGDAIQRDLGKGTPAKIAAWIGPTKLAKAIMYATVTNVVAYLPFGLLDGNTGDFLLALPYVMTAALISSRLVSMTFVPLLGYYLLKAPRTPQKELAPAERRGFSGFYTRFAQGCLQRRWRVLALGGLFIFGGLTAYRQLVQSFFPTDEQYLSYVDIRLPNSASIEATNELSHEVEEIVQQVAKEEKAAGHISSELVNLTSFVGSGGPRFWQTISPELPQTNYAQLVIELSQKEDTSLLVQRLQQEVDKRVSGAIVDVKELLTSPVPQPIELFISGRADIDDLEQQADLQRLRSLGEELRKIVAAAPSSTRVRTAWQAQRPQLNLDIDPDAAALSELSNQSVANASASALSGVNVTSVREGTLQIPV
ncbi:MAG: efflux RND transporter permease subunit, partial [Polyangiaceae bacterium]|nr:efflux RND transporter permease subunit [Polyangiaceae bacterium]